MENKKENRITLAFGITFGLALAAVILILNTPKKPEKIKILPTYTESPLTIYISGEVVSPGLYEVPPGARIADIITLAGGVNISANMETINPAAKVLDGQNIFIPSLTNNDSTQTLTTNGYNLININLCSKDDLISLPGIGEGKAQEILNYRNNQGPFETIEDIMLVPGIGETIFESIKDYITTQ